VPPGSKLLAAKSSGPACKPPNMFCRSR
jgi:hypothetical protein